MTCSLVAPDGDDVDDVVLSWSDDGDQEITSVIGRYEVTEVSEISRIVC